MGWADAHQARVLLGLRTAFPAPGTPCGLSTWARSERSLSDLHQ